MSVEVFTQLGLFGAAVWLAIETGKLRRKTSEQLDFERRSRLETITPFVSLGVGLQNGAFTSIVAKNESNNLGTNALGFIFDCRNSRYLKLPAVLNYLPPREESDEIAIEQQYLELTNLLSELHRQLPKIDQNRLRTAIESATTHDKSRHIVSYIVHDYLAHPYIWFRSFALIDGRARFKAADFSNSPVPLFEL